ncbi:hypothetical protein GOODEAATRI_023221 [Goodea atripinnis]|uniref:Kinesin motor domain-containing protein n=1 Tax=Goodea atripinnis TaxID=208336 RepID=A0ABV0NG91_9TELE
MMAEMMESCFSGIPKRVGPVEVEDIKRNLLGDLDALVAQDCVTMESSNTVVLKAPRISQPNRQGDKSLPQTAQRFTFTQVFGPEASQKTVFEGSVRGLVQDVLQGGNCLVSLSVIFNSMEGRLYGRSDLKPQRCRDFSRLTPDQQAAEISSKRNLLRLLKEVPSGQHKRTVLRLSQDVKGNSFIKGIVLCLTHCYVIRLALCDLAGSERCSRTHNTGERLKEAGNINGSLLTLGKCINAMRLNQNAKSLNLTFQCRFQHHVPFRESKLTHFLQFFFCGSGRVSMVVNINQNSSCFDETLNVLKFSALAQKVVVVNSRPVVLDDSTCHKSAMELSLIIDEADQRRNMLNQGRRSSLVAWETSLEDVLEAEDSEEWKEEEEEEDFMEGTVLEAGGEEEDGDRTMEEETEKVRLLLITCRALMRSCFNVTPLCESERLEKEKEILEERAEKRVEILKNLISKTVDLSVPDDDDCKEGYWKK